MLSDSTKDANRTVLLAALHPIADKFAHELARHGDGLDWEWLLERATAHKVDALLASRVDGVAEAHMPKESRERLEAANVKALACHRRALADLEHVDRCLKEAGIPYILLKGPALTQQVYDHPGQRYFFDLDLVVHEAAFDAAQTAIEKLGYRLWGGSRYLGFAPEGGENLARATKIMRASLKRFAHEMAFVTDDRSLLPLDLHWRLMPRRRIRARAAEQLWQNTTAGSVGGVDLLTLNTEATVLFLAMHAWTNRPWNFALLHLCDVGWALHRLPLDPARLLALADRWGAQGDLARSLYAIDHALGIKPPPELKLPRAALVTTERFRRLATPAVLLEQHARPAPDRWLRWQQEIDWGLAMDSLPSTALLLLAKYTAVIRYHAGHLAGAGRR